MVLRFNFLFLRNTITEKRCSKIFSFAGILNLPVKETNKGKRIGKVTDILIDPETGKVCAVEVSADTFLRKKTAVAVSDIIKVGDEDILVKAERENFSPDGKKALGFGRDLEKKRAVTPGGKILGRIRAGSFDLEAAEPFCLHLSRGLANDLANGYVKIAASGFLAQGKETIIVGGQREKSGALRGE